MGLHAWLAGAGELDAVGAALETLLLIAVGVAVAFDGGGEGDSGEHVLPALVRRKPAGQRHARPAPWPIVMKFGPQEHVVWARGRAEAVPLANAALLLPPASVLPAPGGHAAHVSAAIVALLVAK